MLLSIAGAIIMLLLGAIGFFLRNLVNSVNSLKEVVTILQTTMRDSTILNEKVNDNICLRLDDHQERIKQVEYDLTEVKIKCAKHGE